MSRRGGDPRRQRWRVGGLVGLTAFALAAVGVVADDSVSVAVPVTPVSAAPAALTPPVAKAGPPKPPPTPRNPNLHILAPPGTGKKVIGMGGQVLDDPALRALAQARYTLGLWSQASIHADKAPSVYSWNVAVSWLDIGGDLPRDLLDAIIAVMSRPLPQYDSMDTGKFLRPVVLTQEGSPALFEQLGVPSGSQLLQMVNTNSPGNLHSETAMLNKLELALKRRLTEPEIKQFERERIMGLATDREPCVTQCRAPTQDLAHIFALVPYESSSQQAASKTAIYNLLERGGVMQALDQAHAEQTAAQLIHTGAREPQQKEALERLRLRQPALYQQVLHAWASSRCSPLPEGAAAGRPVPPLLLEVAASGGSGAQSCRDGPADALSQVLDGASKLGGIDFSSLQLRYLSDDPGSGGVQYAFSASPLPAGLQQDPQFGADVVLTAGDDLRTWLVLNPQAFWVNLNPSEPDRIVDAQLGRTGAGEALLKADLAMKKTAGRLVKPTTGFGQKYWDQMNLADGGADDICYTSRLWIVPGDVEVRQDGSSLYILKAHLDVKTQTLHDDGATDPCPGHDPAADARMEAVDRSLLLPKMIQAVNTDPEYAALRQTFLARIVAEWIRQRHEEGHPTSFDSLIDSGDLGTDVVHDGWTPRQTWQQEVDAFTNGDFTYRVTRRNGAQVTEATYRYGGVDLSTLHLTTLSAGEMSHQYPGLAKTAQRSSTTPVTGTDGSVWFGGGTPSRTGALGRAGDTFRDAVTGGRGLAVLLVVALLALVFGFRRRRPQPSAPR